MRGEDSLSHPAERDTPDDSSLREGAKESGDKILRRLRLLRMTALRAVGQGDGSSPHLIRHN